MEVIFTRNSIFSFGATRFCGTRRSLLSVSDRLPY